MLWRIVETELRRQLAELGLEPGTSTPEAVSELLARDVERWRPIVAASGFRVDRWRPKRRERC